MENIPHLDPHEIQEVPEGQEEESFDELDLAGLAINVQRRILQKFDYDTFTIFDETSSLTNVICEESSFILFPKETDKINFIAGLRTFTLNQALGGQAKLVAQACALPVANPDFEENYNDLVKNRSEIELLMLRTSLKGLSLEKFDKLLEAITVEKLSLEGRMGENLLKSSQIQKLKKLLLAQLITVTDEILLEMNTEAPFEVKIERSNLTETGVAKFIKQFLRSQRAAHILQFPKIWNSLENLQGQLKDYENRKLSQEEGQEMIDRVLRGIAMRKPLEAGEDEGFHCKVGNRETFVVPTKDNTYLIVCNEQH